MSVGITALVVAGASAAVSAQRAKKASRAQRRANDAQSRINRLKNFQAKRSFLRQLRQVQAENLVGAIASGVGLESSVFQGQRSSIQKQGEVAVGEFQRMDDLGAEQTAQLNRASRYQAQAATWTAVSNFALSFASMRAGSPGGGTENVQKLGPVDV